jgi:hypothetical protein
MSKVEQVKNLLLAYEFEIITKEEFDKRLPQVLDRSKDDKGKTK